MIAPAMLFAVRAAAARMTPADRAFADAFADSLIGGAGFLMLRPDGSVERLDPATVQVQPPPPPATDTSAFLSRILAAAQAGERVTAEDVARLRKLADWADAAPAPGWDGTLDKGEAARAVEAARKRMAGTSA